MRWDFDEDLGGVFPDRDAAEDQDDLALPDEDDAVRADYTEDDELLRAMAVDGDEFQAYWTRGKGLARWSTKPHPWRTLRRLLRKHPGIRDPEGLASHYFHVVFGYWPGARKGANPVGNEVGRADIDPNVAEEILDLFRAEGIVDEHGHLHAPRGSSIGGQFISKLLKAVGRKRKEESQPKAPRPHRDWSSPRERGAAKGEEIRSELARARTSRDVSRAAAAEAKRIAGRDIPFDLDDADVGIARDYAEGILRGLERFPDARLHGVRLGDAGERIRGREGIVAGHVYAATRAHDDNSFEIIFDADWAARPDEYRAVLAENGQRRRMGRGHATDTPMGTAIHEFGHVVANGSGLNGAAHNTASHWLDDHGHERYYGDSAEERYGSDARRRVALGEDISRYATNNEHELAAEAFADVMVNGDDAGVISRHIFDVFEDHLHD